MRTDTPGSYASMSEALQYVLAEQCRLVGEDPTTVDFRQQGWFYGRSWNEVTELEFTRWLADRLYKDKTLRNSLLEHPRKDRRHCSQAAQEWVFNFGWRRSDYGLPTYKPETLKPLESVQTTRKE